MCGGGGGLVGKSSWKIKGRGAKTLRTILNTDYGQRKENKGHVTDTKVIVIAGWASMYKCHIN